MGLGMISANCYVCDDNGEMPESIQNKEVAKAPALDQIDRRSTSYKKAIKDIMQINPGIGKDDAVKMFNDAYQNS